MYTEQEIASGKIEKNELITHKNITMCNDAPMMVVSSSYIRNAIKDRKDVRYLLTPEVLKYVEEMGFYNK